MPKMIKADRLTRGRDPSARRLGRQQGGGGVRRQGLVLANLTGHDSHGVIAIPTYIDRVAQGSYRAGRAVHDRAGEPDHDGRRRQLGLRLRRRRAGDEVDHREGEEVERRRVHDPAPEPRRPRRRLSDHGGQGRHDRDHDRGLRAARPKAVAPFGGAEARVGTNPIAIAIPSELAGTFCLDMATSSVAAGKINLAIAKGTSIPTGWIVDKDGNADHQPQRLQGWRRAAAAGRRGRPQGLRPLGDGRDALGRCCRASASASIPRAATTTAASSPASRSRRSARSPPSRRR